MSKAHQVVKDVLGESAWGVTVEGTTVTVNLGSAVDGLTFDVLARLSEAFGTRDINFGFEEGGALSEVTYESSRHWLTIRGANLVE